MINIIVACDLKNAIGKDNQLLYTLKDDMANFKALTTGHTVVMGRKTFDSIGSSLPNRHNIVLTKDKSQFKDDYEVTTLTSIDAIITMNHMYPANQYYIIGGEEVYRHFLPHTSRIYLTRVVHHFEGADAFFPEVDFNKWKVVNEEFQEKNERNEHSFYISTLERK